MYQQSILILNSSFIHISFIFSPLHPGLFTRSFHSKFYSSGYLYFDQTYEVNQHLSQLIDFNSIIFFFFQETCRLSVSITVFCSVDNTEFYTLKYAYKYICVCLTTHLHSYTYHYEVYTIRGFYIQFEKASNISCI